jgi:hypothetical protein
MRLATLISILLLTGVALFLAGWFRPQAKPLASLPSSPAATTAPPVDEAPTITVAPTRFDASAPSKLSATAGTNPPDAQTVENRLAELETLALNDDPGSLKLILVALSDPNPKIRATALESTVQFGSRDAIPTLQTVLAKTDLAGEKLKIQEAIEFLRLPPLATSKVKQP